MMSVSQYMDIRYYLNLREGMREGTLKGFG
jgi:hypothetical protein